ncbi:uncharacterized protein BP5553_04679 [Venustampulla echinocandica]|uniref:Box C/D snoRNA protein 1 n=1 Tax=Venustampulla echinocandica TaxID=2656787 RepID=A0A370TNZ8_9HELO|nr:uncharacterized protein BP5553_04679 [Venustampulla echinocandica]RDL37246.1 hypothetical protein BP5553_04679 [Venustampulla echinocandica]
MADPLLSSLCSICHINDPKYTCPRCSIQTCSLPCSRRHKLWSSCNGVRDPTVFKPLSQVATPSGIDHDYNFIHSIEHGIERSEKQIVEDRGLVHKEELRVARHGPDRRRQQRRHGPSGETPIDRLLDVMKIKVIRAPKGMSRSVENITNWSKHQKSINWQVEWIRTDAERLLGKAMGNKPLGEAYDEAFEEDRRRKLSDDERKVEKKRKAEQVRQRSAKRVKLDAQHKLDLTAIPRLQNPETGSWDIVTANSSVLNNTREESQAPDEEHSPSANLAFYLYRPNTPSSFPKVLIPINTSKPLTDLLRKREVLEFPTIYIFEHGTPLPEDFMLENKFLTATGQAPLETSDADTEDTASSVADSDTSTSGSDSSEGEVDEVDDQHMEGG